jgi:hypothetical protein
MGRLYDRLLEGQSPKSQKLMDQLQTVAFAEATEVGA